MNELIACLGNDSGKPHVEKLIGSFSWDNIIIIQSEENIVLNAKKGSAVVNIIKADTKKPSEQLTEDLRNELKKLTKSSQTGINFFSGSGKLHMATIAAALKLGLGIRLIVISPEGIKEL
ncbi:MAG: hypothetical protein Q8O89_02185 [Nanoarchaeota archaeon]|nr:hypothetical protein [Nanoarchaeota archaeon]